MAVIFAVIGSPSKDDMSFVTDQKATQYLEGFRNIEPVNLSEKYPAASADAIDFLNKALVFNPFFRMNLQDAIDHPLFDKVRGTKCEKFQGVPATLEFENLILDSMTLRKLVYKELSSYHK
jgi:mitogen-activated protein kinase 1/3